MMMNCASRLRHNIAGWVDVVPLIGVTLFHLVVGRQKSLLALDADIQYVFGPKKENRI
jgi:hypothetical protein